MKIKRERLNRIIVEELKASLEELSEQDLKEKNRFLDFFRKKVGRPSTKKVVDDPTASKVGASAANAAIGMQNQGPVKPKTPPPVPPDDGQEVGDSDVVDAQAAPTAPVTTSTTPPSTAVSSTAGSTAPEAIKSVAAGPATDKELDFDVDVQDPEDGPMPPPTAQTSASKPSQGSLAFKAAERDKQEQEADVKARQAALSASAEKAKSASAQAATPAGIQQAQKQSKIDVSGVSLPQSVKQSSQNISRPHASILSPIFSKSVAPIILKQLDTFKLSKEEKQKVIKPVLDYLRVLPSLANPTIAEAEIPQAPETPEQKKARLQAQYGQKLAANKAKAAEDEKYKNLSSGKLLHQNMSLLKGQLETMLSNAVGDQQNIKNSLLSFLNKDNSLEAAKLGMSLDNPKVMKNQERAILNNGIQIISNILTIIAANLPHEKPQGTNTSTTKQTPTQQPAPGPVAESYKAMYDKWQKIIKG